MHLTHRWGIKNLTHKWVIIGNKMAKGKLQIPTDIGVSKSIRSPSDVGVLIHYLRKQRNLTQTELSKMTGIKQQTLSAIENGVQNAELKTLFSILSTLNLELVIRPRVQRSHGYAPGKED